MDTRFLAFTLVCAVLIVTPGPDMALVTRTALARGWPAANLVAFGVAAGSAAWGILSTLGVAALLAASPLAFTLLKVAGAAYLVFLGLASLSGHATGGRQDGTRGAAFAQGLLNNLLNPKAAAIFLTVWPQFLRAGDPASRLALMLGAYEVMVVVWLAIYGYAVSRAGRGKLAPRFSLLSQRLTGLVLVGLGARLVVESR
jgi:threonine/homoserine/homoserine lactone efflux protein